MNRDLSQATSEELAGAAQAGSADAFEALVNRFSASLFAFARLRVGDPGEAEELVQECFVRAWRRIQLYDPKRRFSTWLFTIARRQAVSRWRRSRARSGDRSLDAHPTTGDRSDLCAGFDPARLVSGRDEEANLWSVAERVLTPDQRSALWLLFVEELTTEEVAGVLGKRPGTVRVLVFRARTRLAAELPGYREEPLAAPPLPFPTSRLAEGHR